MKRVTFCGHGTVSNEREVEKWLTQVTMDLINQGAKTFYLGGYGEFDSLCKKVLSIHKKTYTEIEILLIVPYLNHKMSTAGYDGTIYPDIEKTPPKFAISARNKWMVEQSDCVVAYVIHGWGGAAKTLEHAKRKKKNIILYKEG